MPIGAQFFIGDPRDLDARIWLGCIGWDGSPHSDPKGLAVASSPEAFADMVASEFGWRGDFTPGTSDGYPFPWDDDIFQTAFTYAYFGGQVQVASFHHGFIPLIAYLRMTQVEMDVHYDTDPGLPMNVPAPARYRGSRVVLMEADADGT